ncbi:MAG: hypothetical protein Q7K57_26275 [Burkholderiaceae bacterium]|nr:hypothetical protein [Burkholderiaceae bacterium]
MLLLPTAAAIRMASGFAALYFSTLPIFLKPLASGFGWGRAQTAPARSSIFLEKFLEKNGFNRRIVLKTPHHLSLPSIVETTDLIGTVALAACARFAQMGTVQLLKTPFVPPSFPVQQHWHRRMHQDARHRWLRAQMVQLFNESQDEWHEIEIALYGKNYRTAQVKLA